MRDWAVSEQFLDALEFLGRQAAIKHTATHDVGGAGKFNGACLKAQDVALALRLVIPKHQLLHNKVGRQLSLLHEQIGRVQQLHVCTSLDIFYAELQRFGFNAVVSSQVKERLGVRQVLQRCSNWTICR